MTPEQSYSTMTRDELIREIENKQRVVEWWATKDYAAPQEPSTATPVSDSSTPAGAAPFLGGAMLGLVFGSMLTLFALSLWV